MVYAQNVRNGVTQLTATTIKQQTAAVRVHGSPYEYVDGTQYEYFGKYFARYMKQWQLLLKRHCATVRPDTGKHSAGRRAPVSRPLTATTARCTQRPATSASQSTVDSHYSTGRRAPVSQPLTATTARCTHSARRRAPVSRPLTATTALGDERQSVDR